MVVLSFLLFTPDAEAGTEKPLSQQWWITDVY